MKTLCRFASIGLLFLVLFAAPIFSQNKEFDKLKDLVDKGKLDKAREYCDKVTVPMDPKTSSRFFALMGLGYFNQKDYTNAAEMLLKSNDKKTSLKLAKIMENESGGNYDLTTAGKLYKVAQEYDLAAGILFKQGQYEESAQICPSPNSSYKFGKQLFDQGKYSDALLYFKKAKTKGKKFDDADVLNYYYKKRDYKTAYYIQNSGEGSFYPAIQGTVIDKMIENNEPTPFVLHFLDSIGVKGTKQIEAILSGMVSNKMYDKAEAYCLEKKGSEQQSAFAFLAEISAGKNYGVSAWANLKSGKTLLGKQQITDYLVETGKAYNLKWDKEPIDNKLIDQYKKETQQMVKKCEQNYCEFAGFAATMSRTKGEELAKSNPTQSGEYSRAAVLLKIVEKNCK